jgi:hypothetical protein
MGSSSSDSATEEDNDLFPADTNAISNTANAGRPLTPQNNHLNALAPGELSPPRSESQSQTQALNQQSSMVDSGHMMANGNGDGNSRQAWTTEGMSRDNRDEPVVDGKPGSGWKSKRAQEEYHRAMESVIDRDFSLREFGDVLAPEETPEKKPS